MKDKYRKKSLGDDLNPQVIKVLELSNIVIIMLFFSAIHYNYYLS